LGQGRDKENPGILDGCKHRVTYFEEVRALVPQASAIVLYSQFRSMVKRYI
jgi:hypothetical protein